MSGQTVQAIITEKIQRDLTKVTYAVLFYDTNEEQQGLIRKWIEDREDYHEEIEDNDGFINWLIDKSKAMGVSADIKSLDKIGKEPVISTVEIDDNE
ncbi:hypothetical protein [Isachenkonia alkalipeptolytica]|uniref:Uncharacterized protein n=1 Tax=Isachenkonia alkalipeptolytica TaxID=2565777 RepID=A0AA43XKU9_9CLOT|nr:hypothetical protein [Isachenkonia alkalipeptolytica]NBG88114.1 hypothetical protein [Isachenkonia alkalipeptolytica]